MEARNLSFVSQQPAVRALWYLVNMVYRRGVVCCNKQHVANSGVQ